MWCSGYQRTGARDWTLTALLQSLPPCHKTLMLTQAAFLLNPSQVAAGIESDPLAVVLPAAIVVRGIL